MRRPLVRSSSLLTALVALQGCAFARDGLFAAAGPVASAERSHVVFVVAMTMLVIAPLLIALPIVLWRYRFTGGRGAYRPEWAFSWTLEGLIWGVPVLVVSVLAWALWIKTHELDPYQPMRSGDAPLKVQVIALDWKWLFIYPGAQVASVNELVVPQGRPIELDLTSDATMQSFIVPRLAGQMFAMAGMQTQLRFRADETGEFTGRNTQYNGAGFPSQSFVVRSVSDADFTRWIAVAHDAPALDAAAYHALSGRFVQPSPSTYGVVEPGLFDRVTAAYHAAAPR